MVANLTERQRQRLALAVFVIDPSAGSLKNQIRA